MRALTSLFKYVKNDEQCFKRFKPSKSVLRRLSLDTMISSDNYKESDLGLDFSTMILRYYRSVSYETFSADVQV